MMYVEYRLQDVAIDVIPTFSNISVWNCSLQTHAVTNGFLNSQCDCERYFPAKTLGPSSSLENMVIGEDFSVLEVSRADAKRINSVFKNTHDCFFVVQP